MGTELPVVSVAFEMCTLNDALCESRSLFLTLQINFLLSFKQDFQGFHEHDLYSYTIVRSF